MYVINAPRIKPARNMPQAPAHPIKYGAIEAGLAASSIEGGGPMSDTAA